MCSCQYSALHTLPLSLDRQFSAHTRNSNTPGKTHIAKLCSAFTHVTVHFIFHSADGCQVSFAPKTKFPSWRHRVLPISNHVNAAEHCNLAKHASIHIGIWSLMEKQKLQPIPFQDFSHMQQSLLVILPSNSNFKFVGERAYWYQNLDPQQKHLITPFF